MVDSVGVQYGTSEIIDQVPEVMAGSSKDGLQTLLTVLHGVH